MAYPVEPGCSMRTSKKYVASTLGTGRSASTSSGAVLLGVRCSSLKNGTVYRTVRLVIVE